MSIPIVVMNAGHGGSELGAIAINGEFEKDINLQVVRYFKELAEPYKDKIKFLYTRLEDKKMSLNERVNFANSKQANLYISVHHNASGVGATGAETIHSIYGGKGQQVAEIIMNEFTKLGQNKRRVFSKHSNVDSNADYFFEIRYTSMPTIITEFAFIDSKDFYDIDSQEERKEQARALLKSILKHFGINEEVEEVSNTENSLIPQWKLDIFNKAYQDGMFTDYNGWLKKIDEPMPCWAIMAMIGNMKK